MGVSCQELFMVTWGRSYVLCFRNIPLYWPGHCLHFNRWLLIGATYFLGYTPILISTYNCSSSKILISCLASRNSVSYIFRTPSSILLNSKGIFNPWTLLLVHRPLAPSALCHGYWHKHLSLCVLSPLHLLPSPPNSPVRTPTLCLPWTHPSSQMWLWTFHTLPILHLGRQISVLYSYHIPFELTCLLFKVLFQTSSPFKTPTLFPSLCWESHFLFFRDDEKRSSWIRSLYMCTMRGVSLLAWEPCVLPSSCVDLATSDVTSELSPMPTMLWLDWPCAISLSCQGLSASGPSHLLFPHR